MRVRFGKKNLNVSSRRTRRVGETPARDFRAVVAGEHQASNAAADEDASGSETASILAFAFASSFAVASSSASHEPPSNQPPSTLPSSPPSTLPSSAPSTLPRRRSLRGFPMAWSARPSRAEAARRRPTRVHTRRLVSPANWRTIARRAVRARPSRVILRWHARYSCMILSHVTSGNPATATASSADPSNAPGAISTAASTTRSSSAASASRLWLVSTSANAVWKSTARVRSKRRTSHTRSADSHGRWLT